jgi:hypothetical protein
MHPILKALTLPRLTPMRPRAAANGGRRRLAKGTGNAGRQRQLLCPAPPRVPAPEHDVAEVNHAGSVAEATRHAPVATSAFRFDAYLTVG